MGTLGTRALLTLNKDRKVKLRNKGFINENLPLYQTKVELSAIVLNEIYESEIKCLSSFCSRSGAFKEQKVPKRRILLFKNFSIYFETTLLQPSFFLFHRTLDLSSAGLDTDRFRGTEPLALVDYNDPKIMPLMVKLQNTAQPKFKPRRILDIHIELLIIVSDYISFT